MIVKYFYGTLDIYTYHSPPPSPRPTHMAVPYHSATAKKHSHERGVSKSLRGPPWLYSNSMGSGDRVPRIQRARKKTHTRPITILVLTRVWPLATILAKFPFWVDPTAVRCRRRTAPSCWILTSHAQLPVEMPGSPTVTRGFFVKHEDRCWFVYLFTTDSLRNINTTNYYLS